MRKFSQVVATAVIALTVGVSAQQKPNFSGRWAIVSPKEGAGTEQTVTQDNKSLTVAEPAKGPSHTMIYPLDGTQRRQPIPGHPEITMMSTATWEGAHLVINTTTSYPKGPPSHSREVWSIDAQGRLVVDYTTTSPGQAPQVTKVIFTKKS